MQNRTALIIDDETKAARLLARQLEEHCPELPVAGIANSAADGFKLINELNPDVVFLDIEMPDGSGFDVLRKFDKFSFSVVFVTAYDHYAIEAFRFAAIDYLLKPISAAQLREAVSRIPEQHPSQITHVLQEVKESQPVKKIAIPDRQGVSFIDLDNIVRCQADRNYTVFYLNNGEKIISARPLNDYENILSDYNFLRVHNSHLVNMSHVYRYIKGEPGIAVLSNQSEVEISRRKKNEFLERLALWPAIRP